MSEATDGLDLLTREERERFRQAVLSEVRERLAKHADDLRRQGDDDAAEIVNDLHDWIYEMETK